MVKPVKEAFTVRLQNNPAGFFDPHTLDCAVGLRWSPHMAGLLYAVKPAYAATHEAQVAALALQRVSKTIVNPLRAVFCETSSNTADDDFVPRSVACVNSTSRAYGDITVASAAL